MKKQLTVFQHFVPQHYLRLWKNSENLVWWHDLQTGENKPRATNRILGEEYLYEKDVVAPTNEIEDFLGTIENAAAPVLQAISDLRPDTTADTVGQDEAMCKKAGLLLSLPGARQKILNFISAQLVRTSRTVKEIEISIGESDLPETVKSELSEANRPYDLVQLGMERLPVRLADSYTMVLSYEEGAPFVTSDHPVAEVLANPKLLPQTGYNVLHKSDTFLSFPLGPSFHCFLLPNDDSNEIIEAVRSALSPWNGDVEIDTSIKWRKLQAGLVTGLRTLQTGFGRKVVIGCRDETELVKTSCLRR